MNMLKKNGGFTLVELIVVIAILAILAAVAVPAYNGYINSANKAADITACDAIKTAAMAAVATEGEVAEVKITAGTSIQVKLVGATDYITLKDSTTPAAGSNAAEFQTFYTSAIPTFKTQDAGKTATVATWAAGVNNGEWAFTASNGDGE